MATVAELQETARELELEFTTKTRKGELEKMIAAERERRADEANARFVEANSTPIPMFVQIRLGLARPSAPRNVPLTLDSRAENFRRQRGGRLLATPAQKRRMRKKFNKNAA